MIKSNAPQKDIKLTWPKRVGTAGNFIYLFEMR